MFPLTVNWIRNLLLSSWKKQKQEQESGTTESELSTSSFELKDDPNEGQNKEEIASTFTDRTYDLNSYTIEKILGVPQWADADLQEATFLTVSEFEQSLSAWEGALQQLLQTFGYNTFSSFMDFYRAYKNSHLSLVDFVSSYQPEISTKSMSCVALSLTLLKWFQQGDKGHQGKLFSLVSCEEDAEDDDVSNNNPSTNSTTTKTAYKMSSKNNVKEHVLLCLKIHLSYCGRSGYILFDPGFHISHAIVVINDGVFPNTGWFIATANSKVTKNYFYEILR